MTLWRKCLFWGGVLWSPTHRLFYPAQYKQQLVRRGDRSYCGGRVWHYKREALRWRSIYLWVIKECKSKTIYLARREGEGYYNTVMTGDVIIISGIMKRCIVATTRYNNGTSDTFLLDCSPLTKISGRGVIGLGLPWTRLLTLSFQSENVGIAKFPLYCLKIRAALIQMMDLWSILIWLKVHGSAPDSKLMERMLK